MAWCGPDVTIVRVGPVAGASAPDAISNSTLMCFGQLRKGYSTELPDTLKEKEFLRTSHAIPRPGFAFRKDAMQVEFGEQHWAVVTAGGGLFSAGDNSWGQLGRGNYADSGFLQLECVFPSSISSVACGRQHTLVVYKPLTRGGQQVWGCGRNTDHQLSVESVRSKDTFFPINISKLTGVPRWVVPMSLATASQPGCFLRIAAGADFSIVSVNNVVGMRGRGYQRLPGSQTTPGFVEFQIPAASAAVLPWHGSPIKHLVAGSEHVLIGCVCDKRLRVWGWGSNHCHQLGFPCFTRVYDKPTEIVYDCPQ
jgi:alpha-tubulin suppressor-like RCC1 family protein